MDLNLKGKKALVTGSSSGIGEAIAKCLAKEGVHVMVQGRKKNELERIVQEITVTGGIAYYIEGDLSKDDDAKRIAEKTLQSFHQLDILVNNAGAFPKEDWLNNTSHDWIDLFNLNVVAMVRMIREFLPQMKMLGWGRMIQIASAAAIRPSPSQPAYGATKAAVVNMSLSLAKELAGTGITVNTVSPGPIATPGLKMMLQNLAKEKNWGIDWKEIEKRAAQEMIPNLVQRFGTPEEVGSLITFLASPVADFITGSHYRIDGGIQ